MKTKLVIKVININGVGYFKGKDFDDVSISAPTHQELWWEIDFYIDKKLQKRIRTTGNITAIWEAENED